MTITSVSTHSGTSANSAGILTIKWKIEHKKGGK